MSRVELLAPAGDLDKLQLALLYGADAVYLGGEQFGLRAPAGTFSLPLLRQALELAHGCGRKLYLTLNAYLHAGEMAQLDAYLESLRPLTLDAYIVSDPGVLSRVRAIDPQREIHLSTQANTLNGPACEFWRAQGVARVNLGRELSLADLRLIRSQTRVELEAFVHGALCVAYSGRCLLSSALTGRSANAGACAQPCRWNYAVVEETRPGRYFPIEEDARGTYLFNSEDLCRLDALPQLLASGIDSCKIEGRMKTLYYVAAVTRVYRAAMDAWCADPTSYVADPLWRAELDKVSHRPYISDLPAGAAAVHREDSRYRQSHDFLGVVRAVAADGRVLVEGRNRFAADEQVEVIGPAMRTLSWSLSGAEDEAGQPCQLIQPNARVWLRPPAPLQVGDLLRRERPVDAGWRLADGAGKKSSPQ